jgi:small conductance mechanosensitive channel
MESVRNIVREAVQDVTFRQRDRDGEVLFNEFADSSINFSVLIWLERSDQLSYRKALSEAMIAIKRALDRAKLTIPFPIRRLDFGADVVGGVRVDATQHSPGAAPAREAPAPS